MSEAVALELIAERDAKLLREGRHGDPFAVLGRHRFGDADIVRVMAPEAAVVEVVGGAKSIRLRPHGHALFAGLIPRAYRKDYKLQITGPNGISIEQDPYRFGLVHDAIDLQQFKTGLHLRVFELLGGRACELEGVRGVAFTVWAPAASWVSVVGDFNHWNA
ncbi:MAG: 1,4-alpha-glucan branching enzyme, partial [Pseudomonadota bacterium]